MNLFDELSNCTLCRDRFAATVTAHVPRPVWRGVHTARILIAGQAPGTRVHASGIPFDDASGDRLRDWMGIDPSVFYDETRIAIIPMAFCFPGLSAKGADLPPPPICAKTWRAPVLGQFPNIKLTLLVGGYAQKWHLGDAKTVSERVANWRARHDVFPLPHPSWRNTGWLKKNPWFDRDLVPALRRAVKEQL